MEWFLMLVGFAVASYAIVANDAIQTLGTFLSSNGQRPWWQLWLFGGGILAAVLVYGWWSHGGDVSYGRLEKIPAPREFSWIYLVPPFVLLGLTRFGVPVSTTFLVLTIFAPGNLEKMVWKSVNGYALALVVAGLLYLAVSATVERHFLATADREPGPQWIVLQWASTGFLWSQWLIQDLANIFVYMPRQLPGWQLAMCLGIMLSLLAYTFYQAGGAIQRVVTSKTNTQDIRSATLIDFLYAVFLLIFKEWSKVPMSTTWVFLGLLAGRELAMSVRLDVRPTRETLRIVVMDGTKLVAGLAVSVALALGLPRVADALAGDAPAVAEQGRPAAETRSP